MIAPTTSAAPAGPHSERPIRIVTVDDQAVFREAARAMIAHTAGFELVGESADGENALRLVREADPDMVILDLRLPGGPDGIETAGRISAEDPTRLLVLVSSADLQDLSQPAEASGVSALVRKNWLTPRMLRGLWVAHRQR